MCMQPCSVVKLETSIFEQHIETPTKYQQNIQMCAP